MISAKGHPIVPRFAVIGEPNEGKSTLVATLAEDDTAKIGPVAGTTIRQVHYEARIGAEVVMRFTDTPGFQNTPIIYDWFEKLPKDAVDLPQKFVDAFHRTPGFEHDCELMRSLIESRDNQVAMLYVVDGTKPISDEDRNQMVFLPRCSAKRVAVINLKSDEQKYLPEWKKLISTLFGSYHVFNARHATFDQRMALLGDLSSVIQDWKEPLREIIQRYEEDWADRIAKSANALMQLVQETLDARVSEPTSRYPSERHAIENRIRTKIESQIRSLEKRYRNAILDIFHHEKPLWKSEDATLLEEDVFSEEAWRFLGLSKEKMIVAGTLAGAIAGGSIDVAVGGASFFLGTLIGGAVGLIGTWMSAGKAIHISANTLLGRLTFKANHDLVAKVDVRSKLLWVVVDRALAYVDLTSKWSHGDRAYADAETLALKSQGLTNQWPREDREIFIEWLGQLAKPKPDHRKMVELERKVFRLLVAKIQLLTKSSPSS